MLRGEKITWEAQEPPGPADPEWGSEDVAASRGNVPKEQGMGGEWGQEGVTGSQDCSSLSAATSSQSSAQAQTSPAELELSA